MPHNYRTLEIFAQQARTDLNALVAAKLQYVLTADTPDLRARAGAIRELREVLKTESEAQVIERVAYTWFNRFCALRFMDANGYNRVRVVSPADGFSQPELLQEAKQGLIDEGLQVDRDRVLDLLAGRTPAADPQQEAYRLLFVATCNALNKPMPFLFEKIADYTELLLPDDLLSDRSVLARVREALTEEACQDVEVLGWLYQYYISEKKDEVFAQLKKNKKITPEDIPAATQLFTPHWIVRYLVENSLGRLWLLNRPNSRLAERMEFYIKPEQQESDFLQVDSPEELTVCDPAVGSGHMLTYAFDLLYSIYEEEGYNPVDIPRLILEKNLYGIEIDERAGALAAFALTMKAREKDRRFFARSASPQICVLREMDVTNAQLAELDWFKALGNDLLTQPLQEALKADLNAFGAVKNVGSLMRPELTLEQIETLQQRIGDGADLFSDSQNQEVRDLLSQLAFLAQRYHVVIANPPYMGGKGMNAALKDFAKKSYKDTKSDLFSMFMERIMEMVEEGGFSGMMTPFTWMFLSSFEKLRSHILNDGTLASLVRPEYHAFFESAYVPICAFTIFEKPQEQFKGSFIDLQDFYGADLQPVKALEAIRNPDCGWFYRASAGDFKKVPGMLIAYWVSEKFLSIFSEYDSLNDVANPRKGLSTGKNDDFIRQWSEISLSKFALFNGVKWYPMTKGGEFRRWYGNNEYVIDWEEDGRRLKAFKGSVIRNEDYYFLEGGSWNDVSMAPFAIRYVPKGFVCNAVGPMVYAAKILSLIAILNSKVAGEILKILAPTMKYEVGAVSLFPIPNEVILDKEYAAKAITFSKNDWDMYEQSWEFLQSPLLWHDRSEEKIEVLYDLSRKIWREDVLDLKNIEEQNNLHFIEAYGLQDELTPEVPLHEITLTCNPHYRYGPGKTEAEYEALQKADTMREFISYAVGCMFGRYSLDKPGLVLANQGDTVDDYLRIVMPSVREASLESGAAVPEEIPRRARDDERVTFMPDSDNVIPILDDAWFEDDIVDRFKQFLRVTFGDEHFTENLAFIEDALGKDIRKYFAREFYTHHVKMYKKRPIYWLFSSPKGSFNALIYMHRYRPDTVSVILNDYLRAFQDKLSTRKRHLEEVSVSASASSRDKTAALKEIGKLEKILAELAAYEKDILYPLALKQIEIDLDDGVKHNYPKFGKALKKVSGLSA